MVNDVRDKLGLVPKLPVCSAGSDGRRITIESVNFVMLLRNDLPAGAIFNWSLNRALFFEFRFRERMPPLKLLHLDVELALR